MNDTGYHLAHETQASKVMYLDSRDGVGPGSGGSEFHAVFEDSMTTREDEGVLVYAPSSEKSSSTVNSSKSPTFSPLKVRCFAIFLSINSAPIFFLS